MDGGGGPKQQAPNFVTECFFLCHLLISFESGRVEKFYMENNKQMNAAISAKDWGQFDRVFAQKVCMDAHVFARPTLNLYLKLFSFTNALMLCSGYAANTPVSPEAFTSLHVFLRDGPKIDENRL